MNRKAERKRQMAVLAKAVSARDDIDALVDAVRQNDAIITAYVADVPLSAPEIEYIAKRDRRILAGIAEVENAAADMRELLSR